ncbi:MAG: hypothetical protein IJK31_04300 [Ruminococcus sp.]|nr:hypothetical protein [Ruminococcus sp.]HRR75897.1 hypothetical protein [Ruminococcus sp.]
MNFKLTAICAAAVLCAASAVSCGKDKDSSSSDVILDINTTTSTEATSESEETTTVTTTGKKDDKKTTTTTAKKEETVTTKAADTEPETADPEPEPGDNNEPEDPDTGGSEPDPVETPTEAPKPKQEVFTPNDLNRPMSDFTAMFGNISPRQVSACIPKGDAGDVLFVYEYSGIEFDCYSSGGTHYVYDIAITGGNYSTDMGIKIGSSRSDVTSAYGESADTDPWYITGNGCVTFTINGDTVSKIQIAE